MPGGVLTDAVGFMVSYAIVAAVLLALAVLIAVQGFGYLSRPIPRAAGADG